MSTGTIAFVCQLALEQRWLLSQAGKAPDDREPYEEWRKKNA